MNNSTWSSGIGKFKKKDPDHGKWWKKIKHWACKVGLCNLDKCKSSYHKDKCCGGGCKNHVKKEVAGGHCLGCGCPLSNTNLNDYCKNCTP